MERFLLLFVGLMSLCSFAQDQKENDSIDLASRSMVQLYLKFPSPVSESARDVIVDGLRSYQDKNIGDAYKLEAKKRIKELNELKFADVQCIDFNSLSSKEKRSWDYKEDKFSGNSFITKSQAWRNNVYPYIVVNSGRMYLRLVTEYKGSDWIFYNKIIFLIDGERYEFVPDAPDRKVEGKGVVLVKERSDTYVYYNTLELLRKIASANTQVEMRFTGKYSADIKLKGRELESIKETLLLYDKLRLNN